MCYELTCKLTLDHGCICFNSTKWAEIPSFTICPRYGKGFKENVIKNELGSHVTITDIRKFNFPINASIDQGFFNRTTFNISELIKSIVITTKDKMVDDYKIKLLFDNPNGTLPDRFFITNNMINFGRCFTLDIPSEVKDLTVPLHITTL